MEEKVQNRIKELREAHGLSIIQLAEATDLSRSTLYSYEARGFNPRGDKLQKLTSFFGVTSGYLLGYEEESLEPKPEPAMDFLSSLDEIAPLLDSKEVLQLTKLESYARSIGLSDKELESMLSAVIGAKLLNP